MHELQPPLPLSRRRRMRVGLMASALLVALLVLWVPTPLRDAIDVRHLADVLRQFGDSPLAPLLMLIAFVVGGLLVFPVNVLIAASVLVFGPWRGALLALLGCTLSAWLLYEIGRRLPNQRLRDWLGRRLDRVRARLAWRGLLTVALVRAVPVAPYSIVNLAAGAAHIDRVAYLAGTVLGMAPGIMLSAAFLDRLLAALGNPGAPSYAGLLITGVLVVAMGAIVFAVRRRRAADLDTTP